MKWYINIDDKIECFQITNNIFSIVCAKYNENNNTIVGIVQADILEKDSCYFYNMKQITEIEFLTLDIFSYMYKYLKKINKKLLKKLRKNKDDKEIKEFINYFAELERIKDEMVYGWL